MISFYHPVLSKNQEKYVRSCMRSGEFFSDGSFCERASKLLQEQTGAKTVLLTPSASHSLELMFHSLCAGDEVILPAYNFPSAANAVLRAGATPVLCEIDPRTQNASAEDILKRVTPRTKAVCITHYAGISFDLDALTVLQNDGILIAEDAAQSLGGHYKGRALGTIGDFGCYSFHATKNVTCGEGGAYLHNSDEESLRKARMFREKGTNRHDFLSGTASRYQWEQLGSSLLLPELCAAMLLAQLEELEQITQKRRYIFSQYHSLLQSEFSSGTLTGMHIPPYASGNGHIYYIKLQNETQLYRVKAGLAEQGIPSLTHFVPLHLGTMGKTLGYRAGDFPESEQAYQTLLRLPMHTQLTENQVEQICNTLKALL